MLANVSAKLALVACAVFLCMTASADTLLSSNTALYGRVIRLAHASDSSVNGQIVASVTSFSHGTTADIYGSLDGGTSFSLLASITDPDFAGGLCCGTLYEVRQTIGTLPAGTLLWAGSVGQNLTDRRMQIKVYASGDGGHTWNFNSSITSPNTGDYWEPQFTVANDGALVMFWSDESQPAQSQLLNRTRTYDGQTWIDFTNTVASTIQADRPGMAVVNRLKSGAYLMTFELCGPAACTVFYKTSPDGWNWGSPSDVGAKISATNGLFFEHAPTNAVLPDGSILLIGQVTLNADGSVAQGNGATIFKNSAGDPTQAWTTLGAPVSVPGAYDNYCPNYSSPLLPSTNGGSVLEFANRYSGSTCLMYYGSGPTQ